MHTQFTTIKPWVVESDDGFRVAITPESVEFRQRFRRVKLNYEWLINNGIGIYTSGLGSSGLFGLKPDVVRDIVAKIESALNFMGFNVEVC